MKIIRVVAAVICDDMQLKRKIFATARGYGDQKGGWEFPGGKIEEAVDVWGQSPNVDIIP